MAREYSHIISTISCHRTARIIRIVISVVPILGCILILNKLQSSDPPLVVKWYATNWTKWNQYIYTPPHQSGVNTSGQPFNNSGQLLNQPIQLSNQSMALVKLTQQPVAPTSFVTLNSQTVDEFVFVTAVSSNHFKECQSAIASIQRSFPARRIILYDLGLTLEQRRELQRWCNVELREFKFENYGAHMKNLGSCAFKSVIVRETILQYGGVFYMDASIRIKENFDWSPILKLAQENGGLVMLTSSGHSIARTTHHDMFKYLPSDINKLIDAHEAQAGAFIMYNTDLIYHSVLHWYYLCSITQQCISPAGSTRQCAKNYNTKQYNLKPSCHRYDQSVLAVLTSNLYEYREESYVTQHYPSVDVDRYNIMNITIQTCSHQII